VKASATLAQLPGAEGPGYDLRSPSRADERAGGSRLQSSIRVPKRGAHASGVCDRDLQPWKGFVSYSPGL
jgi:hypothetical protein